MKASRGEIKIFEILTEAGLNFQEEYSFPDLISTSGRPLRFDFAVFDDNGDLDFLIEYQGIQHYEPKSKFGGISGLRKQQYNDMQKREYCAKHNLYVEHIIKDCGSGLNDKRQGFAQLTDLVVKGKVNKVVIEHKDRLTRFQFNFIKKMYAVFGCEIIVLDDKEDVSDAEELTRDLMALLASFSGKYYDRRSLERRKWNK